MRPELIASTHPETAPENIVQGDCYRISVLTEGLLRLEYSADGIFEDRATQAVWNRDFPKTAFRLIETEDCLEIITSKAHLIYDRREFSSSGLSVQAVGDYSAYSSIWHYGEDFKDLGGTARTLDEADGAVPLEHGIISRCGFSVMDDSRSLALREDGWVEPRREGCIDIYFWAWGHDYYRALKDFYHLCGKSPMVPRYALGNWWSRYYRYSEESYKSLMERFEKEDLPFTVAVIDMDWHLVDIDPKYGSGWTGYTWNRDLFPDPERFMKWLHDRGMHVTLNVHPADGIRAYEEMYPEMAKAMGIDPETEQPVSFDASDPDFFEACFKYIFHPGEKQGVDFWWLDWQSGGISRMKGLDPLWMLNHYHYLDNRRNSRRPMTFSRYAGPGSHRYPVGFSGDTIITWDSLDFQPYFTATASNIGYGMWSHDIGGHMQGFKDDEMAGRWLQFGVFSPIMRLHSSSSEFNGKEPWRYKPEICAMMKEFLRLRHRMIPYLYTMNHRAYEEDIPMILPMYYDHPEEEAAYHVPDEYLFGSEMIAAPVTAPRIPGLNVAKVKVWLPQGIYFDIFTGKKYRGDRTLMMYRGIDSFPVLAKAGAVIPTTGDIAHAGGNPKEICIHIYAGADGAFTLYEDDNESEEYKNGKCAETPMKFLWGKDAEFIIEGAKGDTELIPEKRSYTVKIHGISPCSGRVSVHVNGFTDAPDSHAVYDEDSHTLCCSLEDMPCSARINIRIGNVKESENDIKKEAFEFLNQAEISFALKDELYRLITQDQDSTLLLSRLQAMELDRDLMGVLTEIISA